MRSHLGSFQIQNVQHSLAPRLVLHRVVFYTLLPTFVSTPSKRDDIFGVDGTVKTHRANEGSHSTLIAAVISIVNEITKIETRLVGGITEFFLLHRSNIDRRIG